ncbi:MAG TPA: HAD family hydrolase, partial [Candidatus Bathyarchaeota archaeon]|nr:HAD family hydrolase [Candidatus Bathyarchaeota archaeon]
IKTLKRAGCRIALLSAGVTLATDRICKDAPIDYAVANEILTKNGIISGEVKVNVGYSEKGKILTEMLRKFKVKPSQCAVVGDDETLIPAFKIAGLAIAFNPKTEKVSKNAHITIKTKNLSKTIPHLLKQKI